MCCGVWVALTAGRTRTLLRSWDPIDALWVAYNAILAGLFLIRSRPAVVSMNPVHWIVALLTSFSGLFFGKQPDSASPGLSGVADVLIVAGLIFSGLTALYLGRSYDFLPALRGVQTRGPYRFVRHPMYALSLLMRFSYVLKHPSPQNVVILLIVILLYDRRAAFEESIMRHDARYRSYEEMVRCRFLPKVY